MQRFTAAAAGSVLMVSVIALPAAAGPGSSSAAPWGARGSVTLLDTAADGTAADGGATGTPRFSPDGTRVVFASSASNLVPGDTNGRVDLFVKDLASGVITRVSTTSTGQQATGRERIPSVWDTPTWSPDGRRIAFTSDAENLVPGDTNKMTDIFVKNLATGSTTRASTSSTGRQAIPDPDIRWRYGSSEPVWSPSGRRIAFTSDAPNLVPHDTNGEADVFVKNLTTGQIQRVSTSRRGRQANGSSGSPQWSRSGGRVMFSSDAANLVRKGRTGGAFIKTLASGAIKRVIKRGVGKFSFSEAVFSPNGKRLAVITRARLVRQDRNRCGDVYVKNLRTGKVQRLSAAAKPRLDRGCDPADVQTRNAVWSPDGRGVAFTSEGKTLIPGVGPDPALYLKTLKSGEVTLLSATTRGKPILGWSETVGWSPNGKQIVFRSWADNLPGGDFSSGLYHVYVKTLR